MGGMGGMPSMFTITFMFSIMRMGPIGPISMGISSNTFFCEGSSWS